MVSITLEDVALRANVSPSTVSRVISDSPRISDKTKKRVRKVIEETGYHINYNARNLAVKSTKTIGIVMKNTKEESVHDTFFPEVIRGISELCDEHDFSISLTTGKTEIEILNSTMKMVRGKHVDGLIVLYSKRDDKIIPYLLQEKIPFVLIGKPLSNENEILFVDNNNIQAAKDATNYLIGRGHRKIAYIGSDLEYEVAEARLAGFMEAMDENDLDVPGGYLKTISNDLERGKLIVSELVKLSNLPTAILLTSDFNSLLVLSVLAQNNISVPEEISVVSFDNSRIANITNPPLTSVDTQIYQLGYQAASGVIELITNPKIDKKSIIIPTVIKERDSCKVNRIID